MDMSLNKLWEIVKDREVGMLQSTVSQRVGHDLATEQQQSVNVMVETVNIVMWLLLYS